MRLLSILSFITCVLSLVLADTEIINFHLPISSECSSIRETTTSALVQHEWTILKPSKPLIFNLNSSSPQKGFTLDFKQLRYNVWTIRASWPGSSPTRIKINPPNSSYQFSIESSALSPRMSHHLLRDFMNKYANLEIKDVNQANRESSSLSFDTPITITLEPLILGIIPKTALPTIIIIILSVILVGLNVTRIIRIIELAINQFGDDASPAQGKKID
ncbi:uncharacterized protein L201_007633 [Kwoniella dendrophila CBS 6074]|uniref:GOLD domain-containing protein n=1 Tax=Kwoniella dendrophila CBS 6074 TaxID=1295534 RepID=A0AAX4K6C0_9TREE